MYDAGIYALIETRKGKMPDGGAQDKLARYLLEDGAPAGVRVIVPGKGGHHSAAIIYVARQALIADILRQPDVFGLGPYDKALSGVSFMLTDDGAAYAQRRAILATAFGHQDQSAYATDFDMDEMAETLAGNLARNLAGMNASTGQFDIIRSYGNLVPYLLIERVFGLTGRANPSAYVHLVQLFKWLATRRRLNPGYVTQPMYSLHTEASLILGHVFANFQGRSKILHGLAKSTSGSARRKIREDMQAAKARPGSTLTSHFLSLQDTFVPSTMQQSEFEAHLVSILFEFSATMQMLVSAGFGRILALMGERNLSFAEIIEMMRDKAQADAFIFEALRLKPVTANLMRRVLVDTEFAGESIKKGEYVACMVAHSGMDSHAYPAPDQIILDRDPATYLQWGPYGGMHACFGQRWARAILRQMILNLNLLPELEFLAGTRGTQRQFVGLPESQLVRFKPTKHQMN